MLDFHDPFIQADYEQDAPLPPETVPVFQGMQRNVLLPILQYCRSQYGFGSKLSITSAYRPHAFNESAHGSPRSQHMATEKFCAVDFAPYGDAGARVCDLRPLFEWIRLQSYLPVDQVILEHVMVQRPIDHAWVSAGHDIIHVSWTVGIPRREALEGESNNLVPYTHWPFNQPPPQFPDAGTQ